MLWVSTRACCSDRSKVVASSSAIARSSRVPSHRYHIEAAPLLRQCTLSEFFSYRKSSCPIHSSTISGFLSSCIHKVPFRNCASSWPILQAAENSQVKRHDRLICSLPSEREQRFLLLFPNLTPSRVQISLRPG